MIHRDRDPLLERIPVDLIHLAVMRGLDPRIHHLRKIYAKRMDPRVKPAGDGSGWASADSNRPGAAVGGRRLSCCAVYRPSGGGLPSLAVRTYSSPGRGRYSAVLTKASATSRPWR